MGLVSGIGIGLPFVRKPETSINIDIDKFFASHADTYLVTPSQDDPTDKTAIHCGVVDFLREHKIDKWNGYRYWMAFTPFPPNHPVNAARGENPTIIASNDLVTWVEPDGISNPIEPPPESATRYNADSTLFYENGVLYCIYRSANNYTYCRQSTDGVDWSVRTLLYDMTVNPDIISVPRVVKAGSKYYLYGIGGDEWGNVKISRLNSSTFPAVFNIATREICSFDHSECGMNNVSGVDWDEHLWHFTVKKLDKKYFFVGMWKPGDYNHRYIWLAVSDDGINFTYQKYPFLSRFRDLNESTHDDDWTWDMSNYVCEIIPFLDDGVVKMHCFYCGLFRDYNDSSVLSGWHYLGYTSIEEASCGLNFGVGSGNTINNQRLADLEEAKNLSGDYVFGDDIDREDGPINPTPCGVNYVLNGSYASFTIKDKYIVNNYGGIPPTGFSNLTIENMPANYELIYQMVHKTQGASSDTFPSFHPKFNGSHASSIIIQTGKANSLSFNTWAGGALKLQASFFREDFPGELVEYKIRMIDNTIIFYVNGRESLKYTYTVADFADEATFNAVMAARTIGWRFPSYASEDVMDKIKNISIKEIS